jgi:DUF4097 and DUF4098 domain-containing protein YvlB
MKRPVIITLLIVALVLVCFGIGSVIFFAANGGFRTNNPFDRRNISSQLEESKTVKVDPEKPINLKVSDDSGAVTVTGGDVDTVQIKAVKTAYDSTQARADAEVKTVKFTVEQTGNNITIKYVIPDSMNFNNRVNSVDFTITVPNQTNLDLDNNMGDVSVTDIEGSVVTQTDFGEINVDNVEGALSVRTNSGAVTATSIKANNENIDLKSDFGAITLEKANANTITLDTNSGTVKLNEVRATAKLTASTEFGDVTIENGSADSVSIDTNSGGITLTKLTVKKDIHVEDEFGGIKLDQARAASYDLNTNSGDITIDGVEGKLTAHTEFGGIEVSNAESVTLALRTNSGTVTFNGSLGAGPHTVKSEFGAVDLTLPADVKLNVDLSTEFGKIKSDLPITVTVTESSDSNGDKIAGSINGGGDQLKVETNNGSVTIHAGK